jgi:hypothetical protein
VFTRTRFKLLSRSNLHNKVLWLLVLNFTGSPIRSPLGALTLEAKLEELRCHLGRALNFVGAHGSSLVERLDNVPRCVRGVVGLGVC